MGFNYTGFKGIYKRGLITVEQTQSQRGGSTRHVGHVFSMWIPCGPTLGRKVPSCSRCLGPLCLSGSRSSSSRIESHIFFQGTYIFGENRRSMAIVEAYAGVTESQV